MGTLKSIRFVIDVGFIGHTVRSRAEVYSTSVTPVLRDVWRQTPGEVRIASRARGALPDARGGRGTIANEPRAARLPDGSPRPAPWVRPGPSRRRTPADRAYRKKVGRTAAGIGMSSTMLVDDTQAIGTTLGRPVAVC